MFCAKALPQSMNDICTAMTRYNYFGNSNVKSKTIPCNAIYTQAYH